MTEIRGGFSDNWFVANMSADVLLDPLHSLHGHSPRSIFVNKDIVTPLSKTCIFYIKY